MALLTRSEFCYGVPRPSLMETSEESSKRVASEAKAPQGHRREPFLRNFLGEQKVPRRRQNARRAKKRGPQAQKEQHPKGEKKCFQKWPGPHGPERTTPGGRRETFQKIARAAGPERTTPGGRKEMFPKMARAAGPKRTTPGGRRETFQKMARAAWPIKTFSVK